LRLAGSDTGPRPWRSQALVVCCYFLPLDGRPWDITPEGQVARALTTINILFNLALVATTVRVVTPAAQRRVGERHDPH
jgi:hypothetical protein